MPPALVQPVKCSEPAPAPEAVSSEPELAIGSCCPADIVPARTLAAARFRLPACSARPRPPSSLQLLNTSGRHPVVSVGNLPPRPPSPLPPLSICAPRHHLPPLLPPSLPPFPSSGRPASRTLGRCHSAFATPCIKPQAAPYLSRASCSRLFPPCAPWVVSFLYNPPPTPRYLLTKDAQVCCARHYVTRRECGTRILCLEGTRRLCMHSCACFVYEVCEKIETF